jgi:3-oxoacyl-[acyl-carrier protein] reductase
MNQLDFKGRTAIVTGGAQGIGYAIVKRLAASGATVRIWDHDAKLLQQSITALGNNVSGSAVDVTDAEAVEKAAGSTAESLGRIDVLVNNAGIAGANAPTVDYPIDEWERVIRTNLTGQFLCCRYIVPHMVAKQYGRVVNIASVAGKEGNPNAVAYSASKAGVISLTKSLGKELAQSGVLVNCVTPAAARTAIFDQMTETHIDYMLAKIPMGRFVTVDEVASLVCWLASEECAFSTGGVFDISGGRATYYKSSRDYGYGSTCALVNPPFARAVVFLDSFWSRKEETW